LSWATSSPCSGARAGVPDAPATCHRFDPLAYGHLGDSTVDPTAPSVDPHARAAMRRAQGVLRPVNKPTWPRAGAAATSRAFRAVQLAAPHRRTPPPRLHRRARIKTAKPNLSWPFPVRRPSGPPATRHQCAAAPLPHHSADRPAFPLPCSSTNSATQPPGLLTAPSPTRPNRGGLPATLPSPAPASYIFPPSKPQNEIVVSLLSIPTTSPVHLGDELAGFWISPSLAAARGYIARSEVFPGLERKTQGPVRKKSVFRSRMSRLNL
jgi:hypothetical protein